MKKLLLILLCLPMIGFGQLEERQAPKSNFDLVASRGVKLSTKVLEPEWLLGQVDVKVVGKFSCDRENHIKEFEGFFMLDFFFSEAAMKVMTKDIYSARTLSKFRKSRG